MASHKDKLKHHKLLFELKFLYADLEYHTAALQDAGNNFQKEVMSRMTDPSPPPSNSSTPAPQECSPEQNDAAGAEADKSDIFQIDKKNINKDVKDLYKRIVTVTHPDKLTSLSEEEKKHKRSIFLKATSAAEENRLFALQQIALDLGIDIGLLSDEQVKILELESEKIKKEIKQMTNSYAWVWYNEDSEEGKEELMSSYFDILKTLADKEKNLESEE